MRASEVVVAIGAGLRTRESEIAEVMTRRIAGEIDSSGGDPRLAALRAASIHANVATMIEILAGDIPVDHLQPPTASVEYARRVAQQEIPSNLLVRAYHLGQNVMMRICRAEVSRQDLPTALGLAVLGRFTELVYAYTDWITVSVLETYETERMRRTNTRGHVHPSTVHSLLSATTPDPAEFEIETGYRLDRTHLAAILWYSGNDEAGALPLLDSGTSTLAHAVHADGAPLVTAVDQRTLWIWIPFGRPPAVDPAGAVPVLPEGVRLALGLPGTGFDGFRRSQRQAAAAYRLATVPRIPPPPVTIGFGDPGVAVASLLAEDLDSTREWVREVLGGLAEDTDQAATLRDTLSTFYETGESHLRTAQQMILHRNTVKYRVTKALEATPGGATGHEKLDIALALRICRFLGENVLRPPV
ncbi:PucR family transcriptional regulator [Nocardia sp. NPDC001965]